ncbi:MAG: FKBP-type peptidyl-prolyl cis-trans isomerase [Paludibacter sp.]|nr:FKBP-type peptidyl-prolyl cis-trans isomerase [Paludibacter sp.]
MKQNSRIAIVILMLIISFSACKEDNYVDWKVKNELWLAKNKTQPGVVTTASGLQYKIIDEGWSYNRKPSKSSWVVANYSGKLINDSTFDSGEYNYYLSSAVAGWQEALPKIHDGGSILLYIPSNLGYGTDGSGTSIPPHSTLIFKIDLESSSN